MNRGILAYLGPAERGGCVAAAAEVRGLTPAAVSPQFLLFVSEGMSHSRLPDGSILLGDIFSLSGATCSAPADGWGNFLAFAQQGRRTGIVRAPLTGMPLYWTRREYFWVDILRDGILLYDLPNHALAAPKPLTAADAYEMAAGYFSEGFAEAGRRLEAFAFEFSKAENDKGWLKGAAFALHQAVERLYGCYLLTNTFYFPRSHNIKFLRSLAEDREARLVEAWPRGTKLDRRRFEQLKRAYVEARYSPNYEISADDLKALAASANNLRNIVERLCRERLDQLRSDAGL